MYINAINTFYYKIVVTYSKIKKRILKNIKDEEKKNKNPCKYIWVFLYKLPSLMKTETLSNFLIPVFLASSIVLFLDNTEQLC